jgi:hypothetical protein
MEERTRFGIFPGFVRVSTGLEDVEDLIADFDQALAQIEVDESVQLNLENVESDLEWKPVVTTME